MKTVSGSFDTARSLGDRIMKKSILHSGSSVLTLKSLTFLSVILASASAFALRPGIALAAAQSGAAKRCEAMTSVSWPDPSTRILSAVESGA